MSLVPSGRAAVNAAAAGTVGVLTYDHAKHLAKQAGKVARQAYDYYMQEGATKPQAERRPKRSHNNNTPKPSNHKGLRSNKTLTGGGRQKPAPKNKNSINQVQTIRQNIEYSKPSNSYTARLNERIGTIPAATHLAGQVVFTQALDLANSGPRVNQLGAMFSKWKGKISYTIANTGPHTNGGEYTAFIDPDPKHTWPIVAVTNASNVQKAREMAGSRRINLAQNQMVVHHPQPRTEYWTDAAGSDTRITSAGTLVIMCTVGCANSGTDIFSVEENGWIKFFIPEFNSISLSDCIYATKFNNVAPTIAATQDICCRLGFPSEVNDNAFRYNYGETMPSITNGTNIFPSNLDHANRLALKPGVYTINVEIQTTASFAGSISITCASGATLHFVTLATDPTRSGTSYGTPANNFGCMLHAIVSVNLTASALAFPLSGDCEPSGVFNTPIVQNGQPSSNYGTVFIRPSSSLIDVLWGSVAIRKINMEALSGQIGSAVERPISDRLHELESIIAKLKLTPPTTPHIIVDEDDCKLPISESFINRTFDNALSTIKRRAASNK